MRLWLHWVSDGFKSGLVPLDADAGRRRPRTKMADRPDPPGPLPSEPHAWVEQKEWIPRSILYGPPR